MPQELTAHEPVATALATVDRLLAIGRQIELAIPEETEELWDLAIDLENRAAINDAKRGLVYLTLKERLPHGAFESAVQERGIAPQRAREAMSIANLLLRLGDGNSNRRLGGDFKPAELLALPKKKLLALASIPPDALEAATQQGELNLDEVALMPINDLRNHARKLKGLQARADAEVVTLRDELSQARHQVDALRGHGIQSRSYPPSVLRARQDSTILAERALQSLDEIDEIVRVWEDIRNSDVPSGPPGEVALSAGLAVVWHNLRAVEARATYLLNRLHEVYGETGLMPASADEIPLLTEQEARRVLATREAMLVTAKIDKTARESARLAAGDVRRKAGRPAGAKNKPKE